MWYRIHRGVIYMTNNEKQFSVGEIAALTGLTVRTLQHYDNIWLLPVSGRTEGGRRYYTEKDLLKLEQIVFYKSIGVSLEEIGQKLEDVPTLAALEEMFNHHLGATVQKIDALHLTLAVIESTLEIVRTGNYPPWNRMTNLIRSFGSGSLMDWAEFSFDEELLEKLKLNHLTDSHTAALDFYHTLREMMVTAATLSQTGCAPDCLAAQVLAKRWWDMIISITGGGNETSKAFASLNQNREAWPKQDRKLLKLGKISLRRHWIYISLRTISRFQRH